MNHKYPLIKLTVPIDWPVFEIPWTPEKISIDMINMEKVATHPIDSRLLERGQQYLVKSPSLIIDLRQNDNHQGGAMLISGNATYEEHVIDYKYRTIKPID